MIACMQRGKLMRYLKTIEFGGLTHVCFSKNVSCQTWLLACSCSLEDWFFS